MIKQMYIGDMSTDIAGVVFHYINTLKKNGVHKYLWTSVITNKLNHT